MGGGLSVDSLKNRGQPQQQPAMHKPNQKQKPGGEALPGTDQAKTALTPQAIWKIMKSPEFTAEQLPGLWQQIVEFAVTGLTIDRRDQWIHGIEAMYRRCETYPQHAKLAAVLSGMPGGAWYDADWVMTQALNLLKQATPEQLQRALTYGQQHPTGWWQPSDDVLTWADDAQLTGQILAQIDWHSGMADEVATPEDETSDNGRMRHIVEQIQQQLLEGSENAWTVFLGIVGPGNNIGDTAELAKTIELQNRPGRTET